MSLSVFWSIWLINDDETTPDPTAAADYIENDCIFAGCLNYVTVSSRP